MNNFITNFNQNNFTYNKIDIMNLIEYDINELNFITTNTNLNNIKIYFASYLNINNFTKLIINARINLDNIYIYIYNYINNVNISFLGSNISIYFFNNYHFNASFTIYSNSNIIIGERTTANSLFVTCDNSDLIIEKDCMISHNVTMQTNDQHKIIDLTSDRIINDRRSIVHCSEHVWIGKNAIILKNCHIGRGSIIGAGSVVTQDIHQFCICAGNPAKIIKQQVSWIRNFEKNNYEIDLFNKRSVVC